MVTGHDDCTTALCVGEYETILGGVISMAHEMNDNTNIRYDKLFMPTPLYIICFYL
jgi:hypothetical protein